MEDWFINFLKNYEGFIAYPKKDKDGDWVIGYSTKELSNGKTVTEHTKPIDKIEADKAMRRHLLKLQDNIIKYFPKFNEFPKQVLYGLLNMGYRGGPDYFSNSPKFTKALNEGWDDGVLTNEEYKKILNEMDFTATNNLLDRNERMAAMLGNLYNPADSTTINKVTTHGSPYLGWHLTGAYYLRDSKSKFNYFDIFNHGRKDVLWF